MSLNQWSVMHPLRGLKELCAVILLMFLSGYTAQQVAQQRIVQGPEDTEVVFGDTVRLKCKVENQVGTVMWSRRKYVLGFDRALPKFDRLAMVGSSAEGEYDLEIKDVQLSDEDIYQCQISSKPNQPIQKSREVKLTVLVPPSEPLFVDLDDKHKIRGREGHTITSRCQVQGGKPHATVEWFIASDPDGQNITRSLPQELPLEILTHNGLVDVESTLKFKPEAYDDQKYLVCAAKHPAIENVMTATAKLFILTKPKILVSLNSSQNSLVENGFAVLSCVQSRLVANGSAESRSANRISSLRFQWYRDGIMIESAADSLLHITKLNRSIHHNAKFTCRAENEAGWTEASYKLDVKYAPYFKSKVQKRVASVGESVTFICEVDSNPPPLRFKWTKAGPPFGRKFESLGQNLTLTSLKYINEGKYICEVTTGRYSPIFQTNYLYIKGPPRVTIDNAPDAVQGGNAKIYCKITGYPKAADNNATWYKGTTPIPQTSHKFEISYSRPNQEEMYSVLLIKSVLPIDFDVYNCTVFNEFGPGWATIRLVEATDFPAYFMIPGVVGGCLAILFIAAAIVWANRKYLCHSKASVATAPSDDQSDLTIKMEDIGQRGVSLTYFPDIYSSGPTEASDLLSSRTYIAIPQENPDFDDIVLPPYHHHFVRMPQQQYAANNNNRSASGSLNNVFNGGGGSLTPRGGTGSNSSSPPLLSNALPPHATSFPANHPGLYPILLGQPAGRFSYAPSMEDKIAVTVPTYASHNPVYGPLLTTADGAVGVHANFVNVSRQIMPFSADSLANPPTHSTAKSYDTTGPPVAMMTSSNRPFDTAVASSSAVDGYTPHFSVAANRKLPPASYSTFGRYGLGSDGDNASAGHAPALPPYSHCNYHHPVNAAPNPFPYATVNGANHYGAHNNNFALETVPEVSTPDILAEELRVGAGAPYFGMMTSTVAGLDGGVNGSVQRCDSQISTHV